MTQEYMSAAQPWTRQNDLNALSFFIGQKIGRINTALPVQILSVDPSEKGTSGPAGYVDVLPMICMTDAAGNAVPPGTIFHLPYFRLQSGNAAVVIDPQPGDIGLAVFAQLDCSVLKTGDKSPVQMGSYRHYDKADGFYIGGFLGQTPETWIEMTQNGVINIKAAGGINIDAPNVTVTGDVTSGGISYLNHTHTGVHGETSAPH